MGSTTCIVATREAVPGAALVRLAPAALREALRQGANLGTSAPAAALVVVARLVVALGLGAWRTASRDAQAPRGRAAVYG